VDPTIYHVTDGAVTLHTGKSLVVRSHSAAALVCAIPEALLERVEYVQLLSPEVDPKPLATWEPPVPIEIVLRSPAVQYGELYKFVALRERHPIRVTVSVVPGFAKAVRLAAALQFPVKLDVEQPDEQLVDELLEVLDLYLHRSTVTRPVEYFHSVLLSFFDDTSDSLWQIQDEDPAWDRFVSDAPEPVARRRMAGAGDRDPAAFVETFWQELRDEGRECATCEFAAVCRGYFKFPDREYDCTGVKKIFGELEAAARTVAGDLEAAAS
jgi:hypothetical protein